MAPQGRMRDSLPSALFILSPSIIQSKNLNPLAYINFSGLHPKNTTPHHITSKSSSFRRLLNSPDHPDSPRLKRSLHCRLNIKHGIHSRKCWGHHIQPLSHPCVRAEVKLAKALIQQPHQVVWTPGSYCPLQTSYSVSDGCFWWPKEEKPASSRPNKNRVWSRE